MDENERLECATDLNDRPDMEESLFAVYFSKKTYVLLNHTQTTTARTEMMSNAKRSLQVCTVPPARRTLVVVESLVTSDFIPNLLQLRSN